MKARHLIVAALLTLTLAAAGSATAATVTVTVEPLIREQGGLGGGAPPSDDGGGYPGCWRAYVEAWDSHWTGSRWHHYFNPYWCGNGSVVTYADPSWHYQTTSSFTARTGSAGGTSAAASAALGSAFMPRRGFRSTSAGGRATSTTTATSRSTAQMG